LLGPDEKLTSIDTIDDEKTLLASGENKTIYLSPFQRRELIEYYVVNLSKFLVHRNIDIQLRTEGGKVNFYFMNFTQFKIWQNGSMPYGEISKEKVENIQLTLFPKNVWQRYYLVFLNKENININVSIKIHQQFIIKILDYNRAFTWLKIALLSIASLFMLQYTLKVTPDDIINKWIDKITNKIFQEKTWKYIKREPYQPFFIFIIIIANSIFFIISIILSLKADVSFIIINQMWKDYLYRFLIFIFLLSVILVTFLMVAIILWHLLCLPLIRKYYSNLEIYRETTETFNKFLKELLKKPFSIIFFFCYFTLLIFMLTKELNLYLYIFTSISSFIVYIAYIGSLAYFKVFKIHQIIATNLSNTDLKATFNSTRSIRIENALRCHKAMVNSCIIISIIIILILMIFFPILDLIFAYIVKSSVLAITQILQFNKIEFFNIINPFFLYTFPLYTVIYYYLFVFFLILYLPKNKEIKDILVELILELIFFFVIFGLNLWLQSFLITIDPQTVLISLLSSFIASSLRRYLEDIKKF
jgi:hypothetical protein